MKKRKERIQWRNQIVNLVAIIVGVYVAYYLTNIKSEWDQNRQERFYLISLQHDLEEDQKALKQSVDTLRHFRNVMKEFTQRLISRSGADSILDNTITALYVQVPFIPQDNTYQTLLYGGMSTVRDIELRKSIVELYNQHYGFIKIVDQLIADQKNNVLLPYLMDRTQFTDGGRVNKSILAENKFVNLTFTSYYSLQKKLEVDSVALREGRHLLDMLSARIKE